MSTETKVGPVGTGANEWIKVGVVSGVILGVILGVLLWAAGEMPMIGSLIGMPTVVGGWIFHTVLIVAVTTGFAAALSTPPLARYGRNLRTVVLLGLAYGVVIWVVVDAVVLSYLAVSVGIPEARFPGFAIETLVEDLVIGVVVALFYVGNRRWLLSASKPEGSATGPSN